MCIVKEPVTPFWTREIYVGSLPSQACARDNPEALHFLFPVSLEREETSVWLLIPV